MPIRAVIFDIGGVLYRSSGNAAQRRWEEQLGLQPGDLFKLVFGNAVALAANSGKVAQDEVWAKINRRLGLPPEELAQLKDEIWNDGAWDEELLAFLRSLKPRYRLGIVSNAWPDTREAVQPWISRDTFDVIVYSCEEGVCKPDAEIYLRTLERLGVAAEEAVFVDDKLENAEGARALGMAAIQFTTTAEVLAQLTRLLEG